MKSETKWFSLLSFLEETKPDIICLQETNTSVLPPHSTQSQYNFLLNPSERNYSGTMIAYKTSSGISVESHEILIGGYAQKVVFKIFNKTLHVFNVYIPHDASVANIIVDKLKICLSYLTINIDEWVLISGDYNCTLVPSRDRLNSSERNPVISQKLSEINSVYALQDVWLLTNPRKQGYTFHTESSASRIDRIYCTDRLISHVVSAKLLASFSDHFALSVLLTIRDKENKISLWRFDNKLLNDSSYIECINNYITSIMSDRTKDAKSWWESFKLGIGELTAIYVRLKRDCDRVVLDNINILLSRLSDETADDTLNEIRRLKEQAKNIYFAKGETKLRSAGLSHIISMDRPTAETLSPMFTAKRRFEDLLHNGAIVTDPKQICSLIKRHFDDLYSASGSLVDPTSPLYESMKTLTDTES